MHGNTARLEAESVHWTLREQALREPAYLALLSQKAAVDGLLRVLKTGLETYRRKVFPGVASLYDDDGAALYMPSNSHAKARRRLRTRLVRELQDQQGTAMDNGDGVDGVVFRYAGFDTWETDY